MALITLLRRSLFISAVAFLLSPASVIIHPCNGTKNFCSVCPSLQVLWLNKMELAFLGRGSARAVTDWRAWTLIMLSDTNGIDCWLEMANSATTGAVGPGKRLAHGSGDGTLPVWGPRASFSSDQDKAKLREQARECYRKANCDSPINIIRTLYAVTYFNMTKNPVASRIMHRELHREQYRRRRDYSGT